MWSVDIRHRATVLVLLVEAGRLVVVSLGGFVLRVSHAGRRGRTAKSNTTATILSKGGGIVVIIGAAAVVVVTVSNTESAGVGAAVGDDKTTIVGRVAWNTMGGAVVGQVMMMMMRVRGRRRRRHTLGMVGTEHARTHVVLVAYVKVEVAAVLGRRGMLQQRLLVLTMTKSDVAGAGAAKVRALSAVVTLCLGGAVIAQGHVLVVEVAAAAGVGVAVLVVLGTPPSGGTRLARGDTSRPVGDLTAQDADGVQLVDPPGAMVHLVERRRLSLSLSGGSSNSRGKVVLNVIVVKGRVGQVHDALQTLVDAVGQTKPVAGAFLVLHGGERLEELDLGAEDDAAVDGVVAVLARDGAVAVGAKVEVDNSAAAATAEGLDGLGVHETWDLADGGREIGEVGGELLLGALHRALGAGAGGGHNSLGLTVVRQVDNLRFNRVHDGVLLSL